MAWELVKLESKKISNENLDELYGIVENLMGILMEYFFCSDKCVGKYFGDKKSFTTLKDWNDNGPGLTWKEFQDSWDDIDDNEYAYDWQLDICSYTDWSRGHEDVDVYDQDGKTYNFDDVCDDSRYEFQEGL